MHGIKLPFTGLIVSSLATTCIILIAYHIPSRTAILKATIIVALFKLMLSPHSPPTAYMAVFFQGLLGQFLFNGKRYFKLAAVILCILSLVESAIQRIIVLVIIYGNDFWKAVNLFIQKLTSDKEVTNYSLWLAVGYILIHAIVGIFVGLYASKIAVASSKWQEQMPLLLFDKTLIENDDPIIQKKKKSKGKLFFVLIWFTLISLYVHAYFIPQQALLPSNIFFNILVRSALILLTWYLLVSPLLMRLIKVALRSQRKKFQSEINEVMLLIPRIKFIFKQSLLLSAETKGIKRFKYFFKILLINVLAE